MPTAIAHAGASSLPLPLEQAVFALGVGLLVLLLVAYDLFSERWAGGG